jgi:hypothetical protein
MLVAGGLEAGGTNSALSGRFVLTDVAKPESTFTIADHDISFRN